MGKLKKVRQERVRKRKNFLPTLIITVLLWLLLFFILYFIEPDTFGVIPLFFLLIFNALLFTFSTILINTRRGLIIATSLTFFLILRFLGVGNILNFILILGLVLTTELYFIRRN